MAYKFTTIIQREGTWFVARCAELGVVSQGKTLDQAQDNIREAVELFLEDNPKSRQYMLQRAPLVTVLELKK